MLSFRSEADLIMHRHLIVYPLVTKYLLDSLTLWGFESYTSATGKEAVCRKMQGLDLVMTETPMTTEKGEV